MKTPVLKKQDQQADIAANKPKRLTVDMVDELFRSAENWTDIRQIMVNVNYYVGNQWIGWNRSERRIQMLPVQQGVERITRNKVRPRITTLLAKHIKNKIKYDVIPGSKDQKSVDAARGADKFLQFMWEELGFTQKTRDIFLNMLIKKRCWVKTWFDAEAGDDITPTEGDRGYEQWSQGDKKKVYTGVIRARICDALTIFADPTATCEEEIKWIVERKATDVDEIFERYGKQVSPDANIDFLNAYDTSRLGGDGIAMTQVKRKENMALLYELWKKPCKEYPKGAKITIAGGVELDYSEESGELPYTLFGYIPIPGSIQYDAMVTDMVPIQREINVIRTMIATHARRLGNAMWLNPVGSNVDEEELVNEHGGIINYTPANSMKPERVEAPDIPSFYDRALNNESIDMDDASGAREVSQGRLPAGLDTASGLELMVEQENEKLAMGSQNYETGMQKVMRRILKLLKAHYTEERQGRIVGEGNEIEVINFNGSDLTGAEDVRMVEGSSLPEMKAAQQDRIVTMWDKGAILKKDGTPDSQTFLRMMGMGDSTELFEQSLLDENNAKMEDKTFEDMGQNPGAVEAATQYAVVYQQTLKTLQERQVPPEQWKQFLPPAPPGTPDIWDSDDDEVHLYNHNTFRKTSRYRTLPPPLRMLVDLHYQKHLDRLQAPMIAQQQAEAATANGQQQQSQQQVVMAAQEADKNRQHQMAMQQADQQAGAQSDLLKAGTALAAASMRGAGANGPV